MSYKIKGTRIPPSAFQLFYYQLFSRILNIALGHSLPYFFNVSYPRVNILPERGIFRNAQWLWFCLLFLYLNLLQ